MAHNDYRYQSKVLISLSLNITIIITYKLLQAFFTDSDSPSVMVYYLSAGEFTDTKHPITILSLIIKLVKFQFHQMMIASLYKSVITPFSSKYMFWFSFLFLMPKCHLNERSLMILYLRCLL